MAKKNLTKQEKTKMRLAAAATHGPPPFKYLLKKLLKKKGYTVKGNTIVKGMRPLPHNKVYVRIPAPPIPPPRPVPAKVQFDDKIGTSQRRLTSNYNPVQLRGFSEIRPEILCLTDFKPAYRRSASIKQLHNDKSLLPVGEKLKVMLALSRLRNHNIKQLIDTLREDDAAAKIIDDIEQEYDSKIGDAIYDIRALAAFIASLEKVKDALNLRKCQRDIMAKIGHRTGEADKASGYQDILEDLGFNRKNIPEFSNTKILMQILHDFNIILTDYSPALLGIVNDERKFDDDPFDIIGNIFDPLQEPSILDDIRRESESGGNYFDTVRTLFQNMTGEAVFKKGSNRIKFLINFLSKEFVISAGLGSRVHNKGMASFGISTTVGNVFDNILGIPAGSVLTLPDAGSRALCGSMSLQDADGNVVLPFESPLIPDDENSFVTGAEFFIDSMIQGQSLLDPTPFVKFITKLEYDANMSQFLIEQRLLALRGKLKSPRISSASFIR